MVIPITRERGAFVPDGTGSFVARTERHVWTRAEVAVRMSVRVRSLPVAFDPMPHVRIEGSALLDSVLATLSFRAEPLGGSQRPSTSRASAVLVPMDHPVEMPRAPAAAGLVGGGAVGLRFVDASGHALGRECVGPLTPDGFTVDQPLRVPAEIALWFSAGFTGVPKTPVVRLGGDMRLFQGIHARLEIQPGTGSQSRSRRDCLLEAVSSDRRIPLAEHQLAGAAGTTPAVSVQLFDGNGTALGTEHSVGRCVSVDARWVRSQRPGPPWVTHGLDEDFRLR